MYFRKEKKVLTCCMMYRDWLPIARCIATYSGHPHPQGCAEQGKSDVPHSISLLARGSLVCFLCIIFWSFLFCYCYDFLIA